MPNTITHAYFTKDIYERLEKRIKSKVDIELLKTFGQGPDPLFFYNILNLKCDKNVRIFGKYVQKNKTQDFFKNLIVYIKDNKLENNKEVISYLYGFISHYVLDSTIHPFVFYKTGVCDKKKKETYKYNGLHNDMEVFFDCYLIRVKENMPPRKFKVHKFCFNFNAFSKELSNTIDYVFKKTFGKENMSNIYYDSLKRMKISYRLFRYDPFRIKMYIYKFIDKVLPKYTFRKEPTSYGMKYKNKYHYLNLEKNEWNHPCVKEEIYNYSLIELYIIALKRALKIIEETNKILYKNGDINNITNIFTNISYVTGKDCTLKIRNKYFEF